MSFTPTHKQLEAIEKMETFCQIKSHRSNFQTKDEFDSYFKLLQNRGTKRAKTLNSISSGKTSFQEIANKKQAKLKEYYTSYDALRSYGLGYINRYSPTQKQAEGKLLQKNGDDVIVKKVLDSLKHLIQEEKMITSLVSILRYRGKNINYISTKLYNKKFDGALIKKTIADLRSQGTLLFEYSLEGKFNYYKKKGKSKFEIRRMFIERNEDREIVDTYLEKVFGEEGEIDILKEKVETLKRKNVDSKKIIQRLLGKGFQYTHILEALDG